LLGLVRREEAYVRWIQLLAGSLPLPRRHAGVRVNPSRDQREPNTRRPRLR